MSSYRDVTVPPNEEVAELVCSDLIHNVCSTERKDISDMKCHGGVGAEEYFTKHPNDYIQRILC